MTKNCEPNVSKYIKDNRHLPSFLKDFHDQKDFFKTLWEWQSRSKPKDMERTGLEAHTWVSQHIFTLDVLLRFLAFHVYKLEKIRRPKGMAFYDLPSSIKTCKDMEADMLQRMLKERQK